MNELFWIKMRLKKHHFSAITPAKLVILYMILQFLALIFVQVELVKILAPYQCQKMILYGYIKQL